MKSHWSYFCEHTMKDIFISYSHHDAEQAHHLVDVLHSSGFSVWIDKSGIDLASRWSREIVTAINDCKAFILLLSNASQESASVIKEMSLASEKKKQILPLIVEPVVLSEDFEYQLAGIQHSPITDTDAIIRTLKKLGLEQRPAQETPIVKPTDSRKSLMILPFEDLSPTGDNGWFVDGIISELIGALSNIKSLHIADNQATKEFKQYRGQLTQYAREMKYQYFLQGDVRKQGENVKISTRLLDIETGDYLWQGSHKGSMADIFAIQEEVARKVVDGLKIHLTMAENQKIGQSGTSNPLSYELFLKSEEYFSKRTRESWQYSIRLLDEAISYDPQYATAMVRKSFFLSEFHRIYEQRREFILEAEHLSLKAKEIEPNLADIYQALSSVYLQQNRLEESEAAAKKYIELAPDDQRSHFALGFFYSQTNQPHKAIPYYERCIALSPDNLAGHWNLILNLNSINDAEGSTAAALRALPLFAKHIRLFPDDEHSAVQYGNIFFLAGKKEEASAFLRTSKKLNDGQSYYNLACLAVKLNEYELAVGLLRRSVDTGFRKIEAFQYDVDLEPLRSRQDFQMLLVGLLQ
jgi:adenylate cyclase